VLVLALASGTRLSAKPKVQWKTAVADCGHISAQVTATGTLCIGTERCSQCLPRCERCRRCARVGHRGRACVVPADVKRRTFPHQGLAAKQGQVRCFWLVGIDMGTDAIGQVVLGHRTLERFPIRRPAPPDQSQFERGAFEKVEHVERGCKRSRRLLDECAVGHQGGPRALGKIVTIVVSGEARQGACEHRVRAGKGAVLAFTRPSEESLVVACRGEEGAVPIVEIPQPTLDQPLSLGQETLLSRPLRTA
jgi:hypothetical protein